MILTGGCMCGQWWLLDKLKKDSLKVLTGLVIGRGGFEVG